MRCAPPPLPPLPPPAFADQIVSSVLDAAHAAGKVLTPDEIQQITASAEKYTTTVPGTFDTVPSGYDFRQYDSPWPNIDSTEYVKSQVRGWSAAQGASYVSIGNDLADVNYSSARVGILDEREHYKELQSRLISWLHEDVFETVLPYLAAATPGLQVSRLPDYLAAATWQARDVRPFCRLVSSACDSLTGSIPCQRRACQVAAAR
jgi:capsid protein